MKKKAIGIAAVILALAAGFFVYMVSSAKTEASGAVEAYNTAVQEYNDAIAPYNEAASGIMDANSALQGALDAARTSLEKAAPAYEPDTIDQLESAVQKAEKIFADVPVQIDPLEEQTLPGGFDTKELELVQHEAETALKAVEEAKEKIPEVPEVPDYTKEINEVRAAQKKYEDSVQKLANITAPEDTFVRERVERIKTVAEAQAVTAGNDPNGLLGKEGGYIGCVYFLDERVDRSLLPQEAFAKEKNKDKDAQDSADPAETGNTSETAPTGDTAEAGGSAAEETASTGKTAAAGSSAAEETAAAGDTEAATENASTADPAAAGSSAAAETAAAAAPEAEKENTVDIVMIGTAGGGAVEVFATEEEAKKRAEYIAFFDGSVMDAGPCAVEGTCVIRASKHLAVEEQQKLLIEVREALLAVDE